MLMIERRRHQRVTFASPQSAHFGQLGIRGSGYLENISLGGLLLETDIGLKIGEPLGCEFVLVNEHLIDIPAVVANKVQKYYGIRFQAGLVSQWLIQEAIDTMLLSGRASILSIKDLGGRRVMRIEGGLNKSLHEQFMSGLINSGIQDLDLSGLTHIDREGRNLCKIAAEQYKVNIISSPKNVENI